MSQITKRIKAWIAPRPKGGIYVLVRPDLVAPFKAKIAERGDDPCDVLARAVERYLDDTD